MRTTAAWLALAAVLCLLAGCGEESSASAGASCAPAPGSGDPVGRASEKLARSDDARAEDIVATGGFDTPVRSPGGAMLFLWEVSTRGDDDEGIARTAWVLCSPAGEVTATALGPMTDGDGSVMVTALPLDDGFLLAMSGAGDAWLRIREDGSTQRVRPGRFTTTRAGDEVVAEGGNLLLRPATGELFDINHLMGDLPPTRWIDSLDVAPDGALHAVFTEELDQDPLSYRSWLARREGQRWVEVRQLGAQPTGRLVGTRFVEWVGDGGDTGEPDDPARTRAVAVRDALDQAPVRTIDLPQPLEWMTEWRLTSDRYLLAGEQAWAVVDLAAGTATAVALPGGERPWASGTGGLVAWDGHRWVTSPDGAAWQPAFAG